MCEYVCLPKIIMFADMNRVLYLSTLLLAVVASCNSQKKASKFRFATPEAGTIVKIGDAVSLQLEFPNDASIDSVVYAMDGEVLARKTDSTPVNLDTDQAAFGSRTLSAKLYHDDQEQIAYSNIVVVPP